MDIDNAGLVVKLSGTSRGAPASITHTHRLVHYEYCGAHAGIDHLRVVYGPALFMVEIRDVELWKGARRQMSSACISSEMTRA